LLFGLLKSGALRIEIDPTPFVGLESVTHAVNHLQSGTSIGKVVVDVSRKGGRGFSRL
jgi:NADPH-dependent curcumin reductase CurA